MSVDPTERTLRLLRQRVADLEAEKLEVEERLELAERARADLSLSGFVQSLALDIALAEAAMPDRAVTPVAVSASTYLLPTTAGIGLRFQPPELADRPEGLSTTSIELAKVPSVEGKPPRSLYAVLEDKQRVYGRAEAGRLAGRIVVEVGKALEASGVWTLPFLAEAAVRIGELELKLAEADGDEEASRRAADLLELARSLSSRRRFVAGDLYTLAAALDVTTPTS